MEPTNEFIFKEIDEWKAAVEKHGQGIADGAPDLKTVFEEFKKFCYEYFKEVFYSNLTYSKFDRETVNTVLFEYWEPLRYAAMQQISAVYHPLLKRGYEVLSDFENSLNREFSISTQIPVILYFEKTGKAKRYPFRGIYLIGVPLQDAYNDNWMSIAHEIGHHIYWNARFNKQEKYVVPPPGENFFEEDIKKSVANISSANKKELVQKILSSWTEEIFADIIGARIAKEKYAESTWERVITRSPRTQDLFETDSEHPIPYVIPYISNFVLGKTFDETLWQRYESASINIDKIRKRNAIKADILLNSVEIFVKGINSRLTTIKLDPWQPAQGESQFKALKRFILENDVNLQDIASQSLRKDIALQVFSTDTSRILQKDIDLKFRVALLKPRILDKAEKWRCINCDTNNDSNSQFCSNCNLPTKFVSVIVTNFQQN